jgi:hypothetical protein
MVASCPSNAGGIGGRWRSATEEDKLGINEIARNYYTGGTNVLAANFHTNNHGNSGERYSASAAPRTRNRCREHYHPFLHEPRVGPFVHGSPFDKDQALRSFQTQFRRFDRGSSDRPSTQCLPRSQLATVHPRSHNRGSILRASRYAESSAARTQNIDRGAQLFLTRNWPTNKDLIEMATRKSRRARKKSKDLSMTVTALQLAQAQSNALRQVETTRTSLQTTSKYGHAPRLKPDHTIRIAMENFNSLCVMSGNA